MIKVEVINMIDAKRMNLNELSTATRENLRSLGYGDRTIYMVNSLWRDLEQFLDNRSKLPFLPIYGLEYLHERIGYPECFQPNPMNTNNFAFCHKVPQCNRSSYDLRGNGCIGCALNTLPLGAHCRNHDRIKDDVQNRAGSGNQHCLFQNALAAHNHICGLCEIDKQGTGKDNAQIPLRMVQNFSFRSTQRQKLAGEDHTKNRDDDAQEQIHSVTVEGGSEDASAAAMEQFFKDNL